MKAHARRLAFTASLIAALVAMAIGLFAWQLGSSQRQERALAAEQLEKHASQLANAVANRVDGLVRGIDFALLEIGRDYGADEESFRAVVASLGRLFPPGSLLQLSIAGPEGALTYSNLGPAAGVNIRDREHFKVHLGGGDALFISKPIVGRVSKVRTIQFSRPILRGGRFAGVVVISISPDYIGRVLSAFRLEPNDAVALFDAEGTYLSRFPKGDEAVGRTLGVARPFVGPGAPPRGVFHAEAFVDGNLRTYAWERVTGTSLVVNVGLDERTAFAPQERHFRQSWASAILFSLGILAFGIVVLVLFARLARRQREVVESETRFRQLTMLSSDWYWEQDDRFRFTFMSGDVETRTGISKSEHIGKTRWDLPAPNVSEAEWSRHRAQLDLHEPFRNFVMLRIAADGSERWVSISGDPFFDGRGRFLGYRGTGRDITERRQVLEEIEHSNALLAAVVDSAMDGIIITDEQCHVLRFNPAAERMFGFPEGEMLGKSIGELLPERYREKHVGLVAEFGRTGATSRPMGAFGPVRGLHRSGREFPVEAAISSQNVKGHPIYTVILRDVTERVRTENALRDLTRDLESRVTERTAELEASLSELESFSYSVSHDLRAPLRGISGHAGLLREDLAEGVTPEISRHLESIQKSATQMGELVDNLLELSRTARLPLERKDVDMAVLVGEVVAELRPEAPAHAEIRIADIPGAQCDPTLIRQVWHNLVSNAIKFSSRAEHPRVEIGAERNGEATAYFVRDNGAGFDMRYAGKLFGTFERLHHPKEFEGTGIGLATVHRIISRHGGRVWGEGEPGKGATFRFTLA